MSVRLVPSRTGGSSTAQVAARTAFWIHPDGRYPLVFGGEHVLAGQEIEMAHEAIPDAEAAGLVDRIELAGDDPQEIAVAA